MTNAVFGWSAAASGSASRAGSGSGSTVGRPLAAVCDHDPVRIATWLAARQLAAADAQGVAHALGAVGALRRWLDGVELAAAVRLADLARHTPSLFPEQVVAAATRAGPRHGALVMARVAAAAAFPALGAAVLAGAASGHHLDAVAAADAELPSALRPALRNLASQFAALAVGGAPPDEFRRAVRAEARRIEADDGRARLQRQKSANRLRTWVDRDTGMVRLSGAFDPESGLQLTGRLARAVEALFHGTVPDGCPDDPGARQDFLRAHALLRLVSPGAWPGGQGTARGVEHAGGDGSCRCAVPPERGSWPGQRVDVALVVDAATLLHSPHGGTGVDLGVPGIELPLDTVRRLACLADVSVLAVDAQGVVLHHGRTRRLASRAQRRALRVMHATCAVPGCTVAFDHCEPHHVVWFRNGGATDLDNLVPLCSRHHHLAHEGGWRLTLDRRSLVLTITLPDGVVLRSRPTSRATPRARAPDQAVPP